MKKNNYVICKWGVLLVRFWFNKKICVTWNLHSEFYSGLDGNWVAGQNVSVNLEMMYLFIDRWN